MKEKAMFRENLQLIYEKLGREQLIPVKVAAAYVGCDERTLKKQPDLPIRKLGGRYYVAAVTLANWLA